MRSHQLTTEAAAAGVPRHDWVTEFCGKWSGHEMVAAGDVLDWLMRHVPASPVAPAGVPTDEQIKALWDEHSFAGLSGQTCHNWLEFARAVLSAGAPAVPLQDSVHVADNESTAVTEQAAVGDRARFTVDAPLDVAEFELHCNDEFAASASGTRDQAWSEIQHYAAQYEQDGPIAIYEVTRRLVQCDGRDGVTGSAASSEAAKPLASNEQDGSARCEDCGDKLPKRVCYCRDGCVHVESAVPHQPTGERE
jgi:hypothetical protein